MLFGATSKMATAATMFTPGERDYIRRELDMFFSTYPTVAEGFQLKTWRGGSQAVRAQRARERARPPAPPPRGRGRWGRGGARVDLPPPPPLFFLTDDGLVELRAMM